MKLSYIIAAIEDFAPAALQESWDNTGLQLGLPPEADGECSGVLLCLDVTPEIVAEAVRLGCNLIVSHHPLFFKGVKCIAGRTVAERVAADAIRAGVAIYSSHTALDSTTGGISYEMARRLGATPQRVLAPSKVPMAVMSVTCPRDKAQDVRLLLLDSETPQCDYFDIDSEETSAPDSPGFPESMLRHTPLCRVEACVKVSSVHRLAAAIHAMPGSSAIKIDIVPLDNTNTALGLGITATFDEPVSGRDFAALLKEKFHLTAMQVSAGFDPDMKISRIALCGGSGGEFIGTASADGAQAYVSADIRYHDFAENASNPMPIFDIGHFESEICAKDIFYHIIKNKFPNFAVYYSEFEQNPVKYL